MELCINTHNAEGFDITQLIRSDFVTDSPKYTISPLAKDIVDSPNFNKGFS